MGRIRILPDQVANKIAAGEVVERPASVVKELLENSLDAGATDLRVEVEAGGRRLIRIVDDGCGMLRDDALLAFERHATSKLRDVKDLLSITTLGFRGEALPSIASVSRLLLETRAAEETTGTRIEIAGGRMLRCEEAALGGGTAITVRDLFYNIPARRKFLRTEPTELAHIASLVTHYSLAHPDKTFRLASGPQELLYVTPVGTMKERVYQVFGSQVLEELVDIGVRERELFIPPPSVPPGDGKTYPRSAPNVWAPMSVDVERKLIFLPTGILGRAEVEKWYWEVWNEANGASYWHGGSTPEKNVQEFCKLHDYAVAGVLRALPTARVGGPDVAGAGGGAWLGGWGHGGEGCYSKRASPMAGAFPRPLGRTYVLELSRGVKSIAPNAEVNDARTKADR